MRPAGWAALQYTLAAEVKPAAHLFREEWKRQKVNSERKFKSSSISDFMIEKNILLLRIAIQ